MNKEDKELLLQDLCSRLPYGVKVNTTNPAVKIGVISGISIENKISVGTKYADIVFDCIEVKPYLRPMSSMTEEEAKEIGTLHCLKNILSVKITDEYIDVVIDDGFSSTETITLWYDELISSIECFDWLNKNHFDYRGLISKKLAIAVTKENNPYK